MTAITNTAATEAPAKRKPGRPKKVKLEAATNAETPVDFKTLAAETRAKMNASFSKGVEMTHSAPVPDLILPAVGTRVLVSPHDDEGPMGEPFESVVRAHLSPEEQEASDIESAVLAVIGSDGGFEEHVRLDEVALLEPEDAQTPVPVDTAGSASSVLLPVSDLAPGTLGLHEVPLSRTTRSSCNVRSHYDAAAIEELAASLAAQGQQQNATGRWNAEGQIEIVAGESRRRAQLLRVERGEIEAAFPFLVRISEMTDGEALAISATENMRRRSMTPLEECEAMQRLQDSGRTVEDLAALFGYKSLQPVADRILVARNLLTTPRELLDRGQLSLAQAFVIARAPGAALQNSMTERATHEYRPSSAKELAASLTSGQMLIKCAGFNVEKSGLEVMRDLFDTFEPYFKDKAKALEAQVVHANALAEKRRAKGGRAFVAVETGDSSTFQTYSSRIYEYTNEIDADAGTIIYVCTATGVLTETKNVALIKSAKAQVKPDGTIEKVQVERKMPDSAFQAAHEYRAKASRAAVVGNTHLTLALTVWGLLQANDHGKGRVALGDVGGSGTEHWLPEALQDRLTALHFSITEWPRETRIPHLLNPGGRPADPDKLLRFLLELPDEELLNHLNTLVAVTAYDWSTYFNDRAPAPEYVHIAHLTDAPRWLAESFILTDEWLKRYPRGDLIKLAEEAGLGRALVEDCTTQKQMRGRIMEHAERLHREGFVPSLVRFPEVKA